VDNVSLATHAGKPRLATRPPGCTMIRRARSSPSPEQGTSLEVSGMNKLDANHEAETCREKALYHMGQPEAAVLLRVAREFERLASEPRVRTYRPG
jgi:hypothetical protein